MRLPVRIRSNIGRGMSNDIISFSWNKVPEDLHDGRPGMTWKEKVVIGEESLPRYEEVARNLDRLNLWRQRSRFYLGVWC